LIDFFNYSSPYRSDYYLDTGNFEYLLTNFEWLFPIFLLFVFAVLIVMFKQVFRRNPSLDKKVRIYTGVIFLALYLSHYILRFALYGFDTIVLPFQLCSISMILAIILLFTKNRTIFSFVLYAGIAGGLISLFFPIIGYDSSFYRYYQFMGAHILLILTPIYFMAVHCYVPNKKETIYGFLILQGLATFMVIFNAIVGTDFMFVFINADKVDKFPALSNFGGVPYYLILVEIVGLLYYFIAYNVIKFFSSKIQSKKI